MKKISRLEELNQDKERLLGIAKVVRSKIKIVKRLIKEEEKKNE